MIPRRLLLAAPALLPAARARAQAWVPARPVRLVLPFAPGGLTDILARGLAEPLAQRLGQPVLVENRAGAGGNLAGEAVARAAPDGHTLLVATQGILALNKALYARLAYDPDVDFAPLAMLAVQPNLIVAQPRALPAPTLAALLDAARARPGAVAYGSAGTGSFTHLSMELLRHQAGVEMTHIAYRGSAPMLTDLVAGTIPVGVDGIGTSLPLLRAGSVVALAVTSAARFPALPEIPAVGETLPGFDASPWYGVFAPAATPEAVLAALDAAIRAVLEGPGFRRLLSDRLADPMPVPRAELPALLAREREVWQAAVRRSGASAE